MLTLVRARARVCVCVGGWVLDRSNENARKIFKCSLWCVHMCIHVEIGGGSIKAADQDIKETVLAGADQPLDSALLMERQAFQLLFDTADQKEGMRAFLEKRKPMDHGMFAEAGWQTVRQLGSGSHGRCYLMKRPDGSLLVHKRVPVSHMLAAHQELAEREVNILAAFSHPYIIRYDRAFVRHGQLCIAMEHAAGGDLAGHVRGLVDQSLHPSVDTCLDWFVQLLLALEYVHGYKVLHRDIALKNVFLAEDGTVKLGDFGVSRARGR